jgi:hypothetical protein
MAAAKARLGPDLAGHAALPVGLGGIRCGFSPNHDDAAAPSNRGSVIRIVPLCWQNLLRGCSAVEVFDLFHDPGLATPSHRHHCLAALRGDNVRGAALLAD